MLWHTICKEPPKAVHQAPLKERETTMKHVIWLFLLGTLSTSPLLARDLSPTSQTPQPYPSITVGDGAEDGEISITQRNMKNYPGFNYEAHQYYNRELRERVRLLEAAVRQLQEEVYRLKNSDTPTGYGRPSQRPSYTCFLNTPFDGSFYGKGDTKLEAKAKALNDCEKKDKGYCNANQVTCERAD